MSDNHAHARHLPSSQEVLDTLKQPAVASALSAGVLLLGGLWYMRSNEAAWTGNIKDSASSPQKGTPGEKIVLHGFFGPIGELAGSVSPFTNKVEAFLKFNGLPFEKQSTTFANTPKGRLPYLEHGADKVADSNFIIKYLENTYGSKLKTKQLTDPAEKGRATAMTRMVEDHGYWVSQVYRMYTPEGKKWMARELFQEGRAGNSLTTALTLRSLRAGRMKQLRYQGIVCNSLEEIEILAKDDIDALAGMLGEQQYFFGDTPTAADAAVFGFMENYLYDGCKEGPLAGLVRQHSNLVRFVDSIRKKYYAAELAERSK